MYREAAVIAFRYLSVPDFETFDRMTFYEFNILLEAFNLRQVDEDRKMHWQAFLNYQVTGTKRKGKPVYPTFKKFYDYERELARVQKVPEEDRQNEERIANIGHILYGR